MKFPLAKSPFPPFTLTPDELRAYDEIADGVVVDAIAEYVDFVNVQRRKLDRRRWKPIKTRENVTIYREAYPGEADDDSVVDRPRSAASSDASSYASSCVDSTPEAWNVPKLLGVGSIAGNLDDAMLGCVAPDAECYRLKSAYIEDEAVDWRQLAMLREGTPSDPYNFMSLKWLVKSAPGTSAIIRPRDTTMVDYTGMTTLPNGERVGFFAIHSVHVPACPDLEQSHGIVRIKHSACYLLRAITDNSVEVYITGHLDMGGQLGERLGAYSIATSLISCWRFPWCGQSRKFSWMLKQAALARQRMPLERAEAAATENSKKKPNECPLCRKSISAFRSVSTCQLCLTDVCSKCMTTRKLFHLRNRRGKEDIVQEATQLCKSCVAQATHTSGFDVAVYEFVHSRSMAAQLHKQQVMRRPSSGRNTPHRSPPSSNGSDGVSSSNRCMLHHSVSTSDIQSPRPGSAPPSSAASTSCPVPTSGFRASQDEAWQFQQQQYATSVSSANSSSSTPVSTPQQHQQQLWMQMSQLRFAAEEAYQLTKQNAQAMSATSSIAKMDPRQLVVGKGSE